MAHYSPHKQLLQKARQHVLALHPLPRGIGKAWEPHVCLACRRFVQELDSEGRGLLDAPRHAGKSKKQIVQVISWRCWRNLTSVQQQPGVGVAIGSRMGGRTRPREDTSGRYVKSKLVVDDQAMLIEMVPTPVKAVFRAGRLKFLEHALLWNHAVSYQSRRGDEAVVKEGWG
jgi:hypothetical protein